MLYLGDRSHLGCIKTGVLPLPFSLFVAFAHHPREVGCIGSRVKMVHFPKIHNVYFLASIATVGGMLYVLPITVILNMKI